MSNGAEYKGKSSNPTPMNAPTTTLEQRFERDIGRAGERADRVTAALERKAAFMKANVVPFVNQTRERMWSLMAEARRA